MECYFDMLLDIRAITKLLKLLLMYCVIIFTHLFPQLVLYKYIYNIFTIYFTILF